MNTTGLILLLNGLNQGTGATQRVGERVHFCSIQMRLRMYIEKAAQLPLVASSAVNLQQVRLMLVYDRQTNATLATKADILTSATEVSAMLNMENRARFKVLMDKTFVLDPFNFDANVDTYDFNRTVVQYNKYRKFNLETTYTNANDNTIAGVKTGALLLVLTGSSANTNDDDAKCQGSIRLRFYDN